MNDIPTDEQKIVIDDAFSRLDLTGLDVVGSLRDVRLQLDADEPNHFLGKAWAVDLECPNSDSFVLSFHCILKSDGSLGSAYVYDARSGNEITYI